MTMLKLLVLTALLSVGLAGCAKKRESGYVHVNGAWEVRDEY
jgi:hypothetical protein